MRAGDGKTLFSERRKRGQSGQGVVEYILLLVIAITLVFGVVYQFNDAFRVWADNYFGEYLTCLLETGELPAIGGTGGAASTCADQFKNFSLADGRPYDGGAGAGGNNGSGGNNGKGGGGSNPSDSDSDEDDAKSGRGGSDESGGGGYNRGTSESGMDRGGRFAANNSGDGGASNAKKGKASYTGSTENSVPAGATGVGRGGASNKRRQLDGGYFISNEKRPDESTERPLLKITAEGGTLERQQRMIIKRKLASSGTLEPDKPMEFGDYLRYILIAALIIALVIVIGGQLSQISNELE